MFPVLLLLAAASGAKTDADALLAAGRYAESARLYLELLQQSPEDVELLEGAGESFLRGGRLNQAITLFQRAVTLAPRDRTPLRWLAAALQEANVFDRAYPLLQQLTAADPKDGESRYRLGLLMYQNGYYAAAIDDLDRALALAPAQGGPSPAERDRAEIARAISLAQAGRAGEAETALRLLLEKPANAANLDLRLSLVRVEYEAGRYEAALRESDKALAVGSANSAVHFWRARIFQQQGLLAPAAEEAERSRDLAPDSPSPRNLLVRLYQKLGRPADAAREAAWLRQREAQNPQ